MWAVRAGGSSDVWGVRCEGVSGVVDVRAACVPDLTPCMAVYEAANPRHPCTSHSHVSQRTPAPVERA